MSGLLKLPPFSKLLYILHLQRKSILISFFKIIVGMDNIYIDSLIVSLICLSCTGGVGEIIFTGRLAETDLY